MLDKWDNELWGVFKISTLYMGIKKEIGSSKKILLWYFHIDTLDLELLQFLKYQLLDKSLFFDYSEYFTFRTVLCQ